MRDLGTLPKAHLHLHLTGGMRPATLVELAPGISAEQVVAATQARLVISNELREMRLDRAASVH